MDQAAIIMAAKRLAAAPYSARAANLPAGLENLRADQYRDIRFADEAMIWRTDPLQFRVGLLPAGFYFQLPVSIAVIDAGISHELVTTPGMFELGPSVPAQLSKLALPLSGFSLRARLNSKKVWDEFMRFQGASYFRAIARGQIYGMSARGLAVNIAEPEGEEFPAFTKFWIQKPAPHDNRIIIQALLDSPSVAGAYQFAVQAGVETIVEVDATLFARTTLRALGIAPLTAMFLFDETSSRMRRDDYRPEVHDADGLQITTASGEQLWRSLANPAQLQISAFTTEAPHGFGLMQRSRSAEDFQDLYSQFERGPSVWVEPTSDWGPGSVELVEIPSSRETNDNITAFWRPSGPVIPGKPWHISYRMTWMETPKPQKGFGRVVSTRTGISSVGNRRVFMIDFAGAGEKIEGLRLDLGASSGKISNLSIAPNPAIHGFRAGFELTPNNSDVIELRMRVLLHDKPVTETWLYRWTPG